MDRLETAEDSLLDHIASIRATNLVPCFLKSFDL